MNVHSKIYVIIQFFPEYGSDPCYMQFLANGLFNTNIIGTLYYGRRPLYRNRLYRVIEYDEDTLHEVDINELCAMLSNNTNEIYITVFFCTGSSMLVCLY